MSDTPEYTPLTPQEPKKSRITTLHEYDMIQGFINQHNGLAIDCEIDLLRQFPQFEVLTLKSILEIVFINRSRSYCWRNDANAEKYLKL